MTILTIEDLAGDIPEDMIIQALDDDRDGIPDDRAFAAALASANARAEAIFGGHVPQHYAKASDYAVRIFLLDLLYRRHGDGDNANPWARRAEDEAARLRALASGAEAVDTSSDGVVISKPAYIYNSQGVMS